MTDISSQIGVSTHSSKTNNEMWESRGRYTIHSCKSNPPCAVAGGDETKLAMGDGRYLFVFYLVFFVFYFSD
jgi:hypothetical protein